MRGVGLGILYEHVVGEKQQLVSFTFRTFIFSIFVLKNSGNPSPFAWGMSSVALRYKKQIHKIHKTMGKETDKKRKTQQKGGCAIQ